MLRRYWYWPALGLAIGAWQHYGEGALDLAIGLDWAPIGRVALVVLMLALLVKSLYMIWLISGPRRPY